ncbi:Colicin V production protein [compost metagenome]
MAWQHQTWGGPVVNFLVPADWSLAFVLRPLIVWVGAFVLINALGFLLRLGVRYTPLILADRILGGLFGLVVGVGVLLLPMLFVSYFPLLQQIPVIQDALKSSMLATWLSPTLQSLMELTPGFLGSVK